MNRLTKLMCALAALAASVGAYGSAPILLKSNDIHQEYRRKHAQSEVQNKIASSLVRQIRLRDVQKQAGKGAAARLLSVEGIGETSLKMVSCNVKCIVSDRLIETIRNLQGEIVHVSKRFGSIFVHIPLQNIEALAADADVRRIETPGESKTQKKKNTSEGVTAHRVKSAMSEFGVSGKGVKVGVISDSSLYLEEMQDLGDLPFDVEILPGCSGIGLYDYDENGNKYDLPDTGEGCGMMEIVYDLAPEAKLYFATRGVSEENMAENILALREKGCDVIVDDIGWLYESPFQDGVIARTINQVVNAGCVYLSSAGNQRNVVYANGKAVRGDVWEGDFKAATSNQVAMCRFLVNDGIVPSSDGSILLEGKSYYVHCYGDASIYNYIGPSPDDGYLNAILNWADEWGRSSNDYDMLLYDVPTGEYGIYNDVQSGNGNPQERLGLDGSVCNDYEGLAIVILKKKGASDRFMRLNSYGGTLTQFVDKGTTFGHSCTEKAICVAAAPVVRSGTFTADSPLETFSSEGPRRIFFDQDGTPITQNNFLSGGGQLLNKPDVTGADRAASSWPHVVERAGGVFPGTSAAAPHIAAIVALMMERNPQLTPSQVKDLLISSTFNGYSWDYRAGYGIVDAYAAVKNAGEKEPDPPDNDDVANSIPIYGKKDATSGTNVSATKDDGNIGGLASVWWKWTAPLTADATFSTLFSDFDTDLKIYMGSSLSALTLVAENNDYLSIDTYSSVTFLASAGITYYICVSGVQGATGRISLSWEQIPDAKADLAIAKNSSSTWPKAFFVSTNKHSSVAISSIEAGDKIYRNFAIANIGNKDAGPFTIKHVISGSANRVWTEEYDGITASSVGTTYQYRPNEADYNLNSLPQGSYKYTIYLDSGNAIDESNENNNSDFVEFSIVPSTVEPLQPPTDLTATEQTKSKYISLSWTAGSDPYGDRIGYNVYRSTSSTKPDQPWMMVNTFAKATDATCDAGVRYYYWVTSRSKNGSEGDVAGPISIVPTVDGAGKNVSITASATSSSVHFDFSGIDSCYTFLVYRSTLPSLPVARYASLSSSTTAWDDDDVEPATTYYYWMDLYFGLYSVSKMFTMEIPEVLPDLCFAYLQGWPRSVFLSSAPGNLADEGSFFAGQPIYLYNCWMNNGSASTGRTHVQRHEILDASENVIRSTNIVVSATDAGGWDCMEGTPFDLLQHLRPGQYKYRCILDAQYEAAESDESNNRATFSFEVVNQECDLRFVTYTDWLEYEFIWLGRNDYWSDGIYAPERRFAHGEAPYVNFTMYNETGGYALCPNMLWTVYDYNWNEIKKANVDMDEVLSPERHCLQDEFTWTWNGLFQNLIPGTYCLAITLDPNQIVNDANRANNIRFVQFAITNSTSTSIAEALESNLEFSSSGRTPPFVQTEFSYDGTDAVQFGPCLPGETNTLSMMVTGPGKLSFRWLCSCGSAGPSDQGHRFAFLIDDKVKTFISSDDRGSFRPLREYELPEGSHKISWSYCKDEYDDMYLDSAWLDQVSWTPYIVPSVPVVNSLIGTESDVSIMVNATANATKFRIYRATIKAKPDDVHDEMPANGLTGGEYLDLTAEPGVEYHYWISAVGTGGEGDAVYCGTAYRRASIGASPDEVSFDADGGVKSVRVLANVEWEVRSKPDWVTTTKRTIQVDDRSEVVLEISVGETSSKHEGTVKLVAANGTAHPAYADISVKQKIRQPGPWGDNPVIWDEETATLPPTWLVDVDLSVYGTPATVGSCVAGFDASGVMRAFGIVEDDGGVDICIYALEGTRLHWKVWVYGTDQDDLIDAMGSYVTQTPGDDYYGASIDVRDDVSQTITIAKAGWNLVSFNVLPDDPSPANVFGDEFSKVGSLADMGSLLWTPSYATLTELKAGEPYWINTTAPNLTFSVVGASDPSREFVLKKGYNRIGYALVEEKRTADALKKAIAEGAITYIADDGSLFYPNGGLETMSPGKVYWVYAPAACTIRYDLD